MGFSKVVFKTKMSFSFCFVPKSVPKYFTVNGCAKLDTLLHKFLHMTAHKLPKPICIHIETFHMCENVCFFAHLHTFLQFTLLMTKDLWLQPQAHRSYLPHLLVCKCVNVRNFAHPHILETQHIALSILQLHVCMLGHGVVQQKLQKCGQKCECAKFRTFRSPARVQNVCNVYISTNVRYFARPHACKMCAMCVQVWWAKLFWIFLKKMCAKVQTCKISHVRTRAKCVRCACKCAKRS